MSARWRVLWARNITDFSTYSDNTFYIPLYIDWRQLDKIPLLPLFTVLMEMEVVILCLNAAVNGMLTYKAYNMSSIHKNLKWIYFCHLLEYNAFFVAQLLLMCYQVGWIYIGFESSDDYLLVVCGIVKLHRLWSSWFIIFAVVIERTWATLSIRHYENKRNASLSVFLIILKFLITTHMSINTTKLRMDLITCFIIGYAIIGISFAWINVLIWCNMRMLHTVEKLRSYRDYALSQRYQLKENARVLKITRVFFFIICFNVTTVLIMGIFMQFVIWGKSITPFFVLLMELLIASTPSIFIISLKLMPASYFKATEQPSHTRPITSNTANYPNSDEEATLYFSQLKQMWN